MHLISLVLMVLSMVQTKSMEHHRYQLEMINFEIWKSETFHRSLGIPELVNKYPMVGQTWSENIFKYFKFTAGAIVGAAVEGGENFKNKCVADIASIITSAYHIYYYMTDYMENDT